MRSASLEVVESPGEKQLRSNEWIDRVFRLSNSKGVLFVLGITSSLFGFSFVGVAYFSGCKKPNRPSVRAAASSTFRMDLCIELDRTKICTQFAYKGKLNTCGPTAIINSLQFGNGELRAAYNKIGGETSTDKLLSIIQEFEQVNSLNFGLPIFYDGVYLEDLGLIYESILRKYGVRQPSYLFLNKRTNESKREHLVRIHDYVKSSIWKGFPPVASIRLHDARDSGLAMASHSIVIVRIPESLYEEQQGFVFDYVDPYTGGIHQGYVFVENSRPFRSNVTSRHEQPMVGSPFLNVSVPSAMLWHGGLNENSRTFVTFHHLIGGFDKR
jgi:hypothetical protein